MNYSACTVLICLMSLIAFAQQIHYSGKGKVTIPLGKEDTAKAIDAGIIIVGMTEEEVIQAIGEPFYKSPYKNMSVWWYPDRKFVYFKDSRVTEATFPVRVPKDEL